MAAETYIRPSEVRFTCNEISSVCKDGIRCNDVIENLVTKRNIEELPRLRVVRHNGRYYALDNRLLYIMRAGEFAGAIGKVLVKISQQKRKKWSTKSDGKVVRVSDGDTIMHYKASWLQEKNYTETAIIGMIWFCLLALFVTSCLIYMESDGNGDDITIKTYVKRARGKVA